VALTEEESRELREIATGFGEDALLRIFNAILELPGLLRGSPHPRFVLEAASLRLTRLADLAPIEEVIASLQGAGPPGEPPVAGSSSSRTGPRSTDPAPTPGASARGSSPSPAEQPPGTSAGASSPPPAERPAGAAAGAETDGNGEDSWRARFLASVQARRLSLRTFLEGARRLTVKESTLEIVFAPSQLFIRRSLEAPESRKLIEEAASEASGRPLSISIVIDGSDGGDGDGAEKAAPAGSGKRERMLQAALAQPGVKMVMDAFSGRIVDIKELN
jgi:DNA polymerase-3 subunit gamma/tau